MFIKKNDTVEVKIYFKQKDYKFLALTGEEIQARIKDKKLTEEQANEEYSILTVQMKVLSWGDYNDFQSSAQQTAANGDRYFDYRVYKEDRLKKLTRAWDAVDQEGKPVPVNEQTVTSLAPSIGDAIVKGYDELCFYDEEKEKK